MKSFVKVSFLKKILNFILISFPLIAYGQGTETCVNIDNSFTSYASRTWTGVNGISWNATDARTDQTLTTKAVTIRNGQLNFGLTAAQLSAGIGTLTLNARAPFGTDNGSLELVVNGNVISSNSVSGTASSSKSWTGINVSTITTIVIRQTVSGARITIDDISWTSYSATTPTITATPTTLTGFNYTEGSGPSTTQTTSVSGSNLIGNITLTAPTDYEISLSSGSGFGSSLTLAHTGGTVAATTIYVRLKAGLLTGSYNSQNIVCTSSTAPNVNVTCSGTVSAPLPTVTLSSSNLAVPAGNITQNTTNNIIYAFTLAGSVANATLNSIAFTTSYPGTNVTNLRLYYSTDNVLNTGSDVLLKTIATPGASGSETFSTIGHTINSGTTGYYFITCDVSCMTTGNTISVNALTTGNITLASGTKLGSAFAGGAQTIVASTPNNVTALTTSNCENTGSTVSWTSPTSCSEQVLVFVKAGAFSGSVPTGDGSAYTANTTFGSGTAFDGGFCVYKGTGTSVNVTGLTLGTTYTFVVFTRNGTNWSSGVTTTCTPVIGYCTAASTNTANEYIQGVDIEAISGTTSNPSANTTYSNFTAISTTVTRTETFPVTIYNGDYYSTDIIIIWIDFNQDGDFVDAGETVFTSVSGASAPYVANITIPSSATLGNTRMRIRMYDSGAGTSNSTPCGTHTYGEVEDYTLNIIEPCIPTHTFTSFAPQEGPVGTYVTIIGTGFSATSQVYFDGVLATEVEFVSSTKLIARMPATAETGIIKITENGCYALSATEFTLVEESGTCFSTANPGFTDLFISEVYDSDAGNVAYIELYNPTSNPINLATLNYSIGIDNRTSAGAPVAFDRTIALTGIVPPNSVFLLNIGTSSNTCNNDWDFISGGGGFNEFDNIVLIRNGVNVDRVDCPNNTGFTIMRNGNATAPTMTYAAGDWALSNTEDCAHLGIGPISTFSNPEPLLTDNSSCGLNLSVSVTEGDATPVGDVTYKWFYNDGISLTWTQVTAVIPAGYTITGSTTSNLQINSGVNDISQLTDYQFHCEVIEATTCVNVTEAVKFEGGARPIYRSIAGSTGNWSTVSNWEMANTLAGPWVAACNYPRSINSSQAIIQTGTNIVLDIDNDIDMLTIDGTLEILPNSQLTVYDSVPTGAEFILNGTLLYRANAANQLVLTTTSTWIFNSGATFIKTNNADAMIFRDKFQGGMSNMPAVGTWIYRNNNDGQPFTGTENFFYPDLYIENTGSAGNFGFSTQQTAFNGGTGFATVKGNMFVGTTGTGSVTIYNNNINSNPMLILGNLEVGYSSVFSNELCGTCGTASASLNHGTGVELKGNLTVNGTLQILTGTTERVLRFTGSTIQQVSGSGTITLHKVTVNNTGNYVNLNRNLQARNELNMTQGHIYTNAFMFELGFSTSQLGMLTYTSGFVVGKMRRWFIGTNSNDVTGLYPMGWNDGGLKNRFARIYFTTAPSDGGHLTVEFIPIAMGLAGLTIPQASAGGAPFDVETTEDQGYWKIDNEPTKLVDGAYRIACTGEGFTTITDLTQLTLLKRVGGGNWFCPGNHEVPTGTIAMPTVARNSVSNWSNFGFGAPSINPLPVQLTTFEGICKDGRNLISWTTASEQNTHEFVLESSSDLETWNTISTQQAAGNSTEENDYSFVHASGGNPFYYRLLQTDLDGSSSSSETIFVACSSNDSWSIHPNPANEFVVVQHGGTHGKFTILMTTSEGKIIEQTTIDSKITSSKIVHTQYLASGVYYVTIMDENSGERITEKLVISH